MAKRRMIGKKAREDSLAIHSAMALWLCVAKRPMIGKIAREDSLAIHSYKSNGTLALFSHWSCKMRHVFPVHFGA